MSGQPGSGHPLSGEPVSGEHTIDAGAARQLTLDTEPWLSCDDCFDQVDAAVDQLVEHAAPLPEPLRAHMAGCPACHEEAQALVTLVAGETGRDPAQALHRFDQQLDERLGR